MRLLCRSVRDERLIQKSEKIETTIHFHFELLCCEELCALTHAFLAQGLKVCDVNSALFLLKATKEFKEKSSTLAKSLAERMGLPECSLALPWDVPVYRSGRLEWDLGGMRFSCTNCASDCCSFATYTFISDFHLPSCLQSLAHAVTNLWATLRALTSMRLPLR